MEEDHDLVWGPDQDLSLSSHLTTREGKEKVVIIIYYYYYYIFKEFEDKNFIELWMVELNYLKIEQTIVGEGRQTITLNHLLFFL